MIRIEMSESIEGDTITYKIERTFDGTAQEFVNICQDMARALTFQEDTINKMFNDVR